MHDVERTVQRFEAAYTELLAAARAVRAAIAAERGGTTTSAAPVSSFWLPPDILQIQAVVSECFSLPPGSMTHPRRDAAVTAPRQIAMALCRELTRHPLTKVGAAFARDHGTVSHAVRVVEERAATEPEFAAKLAEVRAKAAAIVAAFRSPPVSRLSR